MSARREFTATQRREMVRRALRNNVLHCEGCGGDLTGKGFEIDHTIPEALVVDKSRKLTIADGKVLGKCCHRGEDGKTNADVARISKTKRTEAKHVGMVTRRKAEIPNRGFDPSPKAAKRAQKRADHAELAAITGWPTTAHGART